MAPANENNTPPVVKQNPYAAELQKKLTEDITDGLQNTVRAMGMIASHAPDTHSPENIIKAIASAAGRLHIAYLSCLPEHEARKLLEEHDMLINHTFTKKAGA